MGLIPSNICPQCGFQAEACTACGKPIFGASATMAKLKGKKAASKNICPACAGMVMGKLAQTAGRAKKGGHDHRVHCCPKCGCKI